VALLAASLAAPAVLAFGTHLLEHIVPLGVFVARRGGPAVPEWVGCLVLRSADKCAIPTWIAMALLLAAIGLGSLRWRGKVALGLLGVSAYVDMHDITAIMHSCWGEAPHFPWCMLGLCW